MIDLENDFYLVRFKTESDAHYVLTQVHGRSSGNYLTVQQWNQSFDSSNDIIESIVAWLRLPGMPLHYYHKCILHLLGQIIGKVFRIDYNNESAVEVALNKSLVSQFLLDGKV